MKISITNLTGTRNRGCEALVSSTIFGIQELIPSAKFSLHTNDPSFDQWRYNGIVEKVYLSSIIKTPNHTKSQFLNKIGYKAIALAEKLAPEKIRGTYVKSLSTIKSSDLVVCTGGDIFTSDYHNLRKHLSYPLIARKKSVFLCSHTIGPFTKPDEDYFLRSLQNIAAISVRETESYEYLKSIDIQTDLHLVADVAFTLPTQGRSEANDYLNDNFGMSFTTPTVAISVSQGIIKYSGLDKSSYYKCFAELIDHLTNLNKQVILIAHVIETNPSNNDVIACMEVMKLVKNKKNVRVISGEPNAVELKGLIGQCECLIGTRTHATIASLSQGIPTVSIAYSRKAHGIMRDIYGVEQGKELTIDAKKITTANMIEAYENSVSKTINQDKINELKKLSKMNFSIAKEITEKNG
ncbi:polysaccharide pyruvyl transferase family protein [Pseudomonas sp. MPC6]|uniref:polysaccharide pyruvyl transferase family protein n=1 Tax=unclassified Pseudomonas TaxID=196821 RepID=UPI00111066EF|nr:polysaccharide pyruvyl transferase family protein [Pseudomonas sp. MPC6]QCY11380.1 hypothetical protein ELQ88_11435 [Pseudomonas sp. MPC6]